MVLGKEVYRRITMEEKEKEFLLLKQEFKSYKEVTDRQIAELVRKTEEQEKRITQLEMNNTKTDLQYEQIMQSLKTLNEKTIPNLTAQVEELKNKPVKRYESIVGSILGAIFGAVGGAIVGLVIK
jgi:alanyl-tRNA synthetase